MNEDEAQDGVGFAAPHIALTTMGLVQSLLDSDQQGIDVVAKAFDESHLHVGLMDLTARMAMGCGDPFGFVAAAASRVLITDTVAGTRQRAGELLTSLALSFSTAEMTETAETQTILGRWSPPPSRGRRTADAVALAATAVLATYVAMVRFDDLQADVDVADLRYARDQMHSGLLALAVQGASPSP